jgi:hypothetical protein
MGYRDGEHHKTALRAGSTLGARPASNWEQALHPGIPKIPPIPLTAPPARYNHAALFSGLNAMEMR